MRVLYVCTANICRSASAAQLLRHDLQQRQVSGVEIRSAGTLARSGMPGCTVAPALRGVEHTSQPLSADLLQWADLVLPAERDHLPSITTLAPSARSRTFTIRQAGRLAQWMVAHGIVAAGAARRDVSSTQWAQTYPPDDPRHFVTALPSEPGDRGRWLAEEMDAARGLVPVPATAAATKASRWRRKAEVVEPHAEDVPDPHELGTQWHEPAYQFLLEATEELAVLLEQVLGSEA